jgi:hypothetical protein
MKNTVDVTGDDPTAIRSQFISGVSAGNPLVALNEIYKRKEEVPTSFCSIPDTTRVCIHYAIQIKFIYSD